MCITKVNENSVEQRCENCGAVREIDFGAVTLGVEHDGYSEPNIIVLPQCDDCPSIEYLFPSVDGEGGEPGDPPVSEHLGLVNTLRDKLLSI